MFIIGPTESGKSSLATQLSIEWGCNHPNAIIKTANNKPLRVLMVQCEDDRQDSREMARCIKFLKLTPEQKALVKKNVHFAQWKACGEKRVITGEDGAPKVLEVSAIDRLLEILQAAIKKFGAVDIIVVNPLSAYAEDGVMGQKNNQNLLYGQIDTFLEEHFCGMIFLHHPPKVGEDKNKARYSLLYIGAGDATLANWARASLIVWPKDKKEGLFELEPGKRARRLGWDGSRFYKWGTEGIFWERASADDVKRFDESAKGKKGQKISASALSEVFRASESKWIVRADLIERLIDRGFARATAHRAVKPGDGYQRQNLEYRTKGKILEIRWNGFPILNPEWENVSSHNETKTR